MTLFINLSQAVLSKIRRSISCAEVLSVGTALHGVVSCIGRVGYGALFVVRTPTKDFCRSFLWGTGLSTSQLQIMYPQVGKMGFGHATL